MIINKTNNLLTNVITVTTFSMCSEYFIGISVIYLTIGMVILTRNVWGLNLQKCLSEFISLILLMTCYLIINDNISLFQTLTFNNAIANDYLSMSTKLIICFFSSIYFFLIADSLNEQKLLSFEYLLILLLAVLGFMLLCSCNDLLTAYLVIELTSFSSYILAAFRKNSIYSIESGIKYFIVGSISSAFLLFGITFIYACTGSICLSDLCELFSTQIDYYPTFSEKIDYYESIIARHYGVINMDEVSIENINSPSTQLYLQTIVWNFQYGNEKENWQEIVARQLLEKFNEKLEISNVMIFSFSAFEKEFFRLVEIGMLAIIFSIFIKLSLAPFHLWSLDVYEGSPTNSTFFFTVVTKLSLFVFLIRFCYMAMPTFFDDWQFYSVWVALLSVVVGSLGGLRQRKLKTLLAYSSISHMGYALLAFCSVSSIGLQITILYLVIYMISGVCSWYTLILLRLKNKTSKYSKELGDLILLNKSNPALAFTFAITMFSLAGIPPFIGFLTKLGVFLALLKEKFYFICVISMLCSVISTFYYIRIVKILYFENVLVGKLYYPIKTNKIWILSVLTFSLLLFFLKPNLLFLLIHFIIFNSLIC